VVNNFSLLDLVIINVNKYASKINIPLRKKLGCVDRTFNPSPNNPYIDRKLAIIFRTQLSCFAKKFKSLEINYANNLKIASYHKNRLN
jgi:hypothetical protein